MVKEGLRKMEGPLEMRMPTKVLSHTSEYNWVQHQTNYYWDIKFWICSTDRLKMCLQKYGGTNCSELLNELNIGH